MIRGKGNAICGGDWFCAVRILRKMRAAQLIEMSVGMKTYPFVLIFSSIG